MPIDYPSLAARVGSEIELVTSLGPVTLRVEEAEPHAGGHPGGSLTFTAPNDPLLEQGTYPVRAGEDEGQLFVVPIGADGDRATYQAVFA